MFAWLQHCFLTGINLGSCGSVAVKEPGWRSSVLEMGSNPGCHRCALDLGT